MLAALPADAVRVNSSLLSLTGKFVDRDGIIYNADGSVDEPGTAAYAREIAMQRSGGWTGSDWDFDPQSQKADSVEQNSEADRIRTYYSSQWDNVKTTAGDVAQRVGDVVSTGVSLAPHLWKIGLVGVAMYFALQAVTKGRA